MPKAHRLSPNMLKRIGTGLLVLLVQYIMYMAMIALPMESEATKESIINRNRFYSLHCYSHRYHENHNGFLSINYSYLWLIVPQVLNGFTQLLVNMTTLEFTCAQASRTMQGLLTGLWGAKLSIRYLVMSSLDHVFFSRLGMLI